MFHLGLLTVLTFNLSLQKCVGYGNRADSTDACSKDNRDHRDYKDLTHKLGGNLPLFHTHSGQNAHLVFAFTNIENVENHENNAADNEDHNEEPARHCAEGVKGCKAVFVCGNIRRRYGIILTQSKGTHFRFKSVIAFRICKGIGCGKCAGNLAFAFSAVIVGNRSRVLFRSVQNRLQSSCAHINAIGRILTCSEHRHRKVVVFRACIYARNRQCIAFGFQRRIGNDHGITNRQLIVHCQFLRDDTDKLACALFKHRTVYDRRIAVYKGGHSAVAAVSDDRKISR